MFSIVSRLSLYTVTCFISTGTDTAGAVDVDTLKDTPPVVATHSLAADGFIRTTCA